MNNCDCCFNDFLAKCETEIVINTNLTAGDSYRWVITNKFGNKYEGTAIAGEEGELTIPVEDLPAGMFTQFSADFLLHLYAGESCTPIKFKLTGEYDCVNFNIHGGTFIKNNIGCLTTFVAGTPPIPTLDQVLAQGGTLTEGRTIQLGGNLLMFDNNDRHFIMIDGTAGNESVIIEVDDGDESSAKLELNANTGSCSVSLIATRENSNVVGMSGSAVDGNLQLSSNDGTHEGVKEFADNAAAIAGGLSVGQVYIRTGHGFDIVV